MDHAEALRMQAAEKYVLAELPVELRDQFEEHFFDCQQCAADVRSAAAFVSTSRSVLRRTPPENDPGRESAFDAVGRFFRPAWTVPALALLLIALSYQTFLSIPNLRQNSNPAAVGSANFISLIGANARAETKSFTIAEGKPLILDVDIPASGNHSAYECQLRDPSGRVVFDSTVSGAEAKNTVHLIVPAAQIQPGSYALSVLGRSPAQGYTGPEVLNIKFTLEVSH